MAREVEITAMVYSITKAQPDYNEDKVDHIADENPMNALR